MRREQTQAVVAGVILVLLAVATVVMAFGIPMGLGYLIGRAS